MATSNIYLCQVVVAGCIVVLLFVRFTIYRQLDVVDQDAKQNIQVPHCLYSVFKFNPKKSIVCVYVRVGVCLKQLPDAKSIHLLKVIMSSHEKSLKMYFLIR